MILQTLKSKNYKLNVMKRRTEILLVVLLTVGALVTSEYIYFSLSEIRLFAEAIIIWIIVVIAVFVTLVFEIYDSMMGR